MTAKKTKGNFTDAFRELEEITEWFERGDVDLDEGLKKFERGLELAKLCKEKLGAVENRVKELKIKFAVREPGEG
ncbi:MAG: Exodeoxyribonuclease VII, small subunit [Candidatus Uhrbacteria bacterium GW2011_GWA2_53_10]|uniref:Exodeoxyribonuclease 7 small subunit n=1 Tax=Candidatus Uhrbacteria bacterium GW2011_GWA2_53_10 TaxID=1618980 RepID=A0A0G1XNG3_9BACT|nr:MAG: Exodeoxyribonuclease VII, small subunit [Candidatus Uhrbacteria bacterium GW2011_GWA2_53_10]